MNFKHFVVVKKYQDGRFFVADPALGNISFPEAQFDEAWDKVDGLGRMFIVFPNGFKPQSSLELTEDDMRFVDDQTISYLAFIEIQENYRQTEHNADSASTLNRVFNADKEAEASDKIIDVPLRTYYRRK